MSQDWPAFTTPQTFDGGSWTATCESVADQRATYRVVVHAYDELQGEIHAVVDASDDVESVRAALARVVAEHLQPRTDGTLVIDGAEWKFVTRVEDDVDWLSFSGRGLIPEDVRRVYIEGPRKDIRFQMENRGEGKPGWWSGHDPQVTWFAIIRAVRIAQRSAEQTCNLADYRVRAEVLTGATVTSRLERATAALGAQDLEAFLDHVVVVGCLTVYGLGEHARAFSEWLATNKAALDAARPQLQRVLEDAVAGGDDERAYRRRSAIAFLNDMCGLSFDTASVDAALRTRDPRGTRFGIPTWDRFRADGQKHWWWTQR